MIDHADFSRQSFLGDDSEFVLSNVRAVVVGLGGGGSHIAQQLAHLGVGEIRLIDPQEIEASNLNRLVGATQADVEAATPKVQIAQRLIKSIRPWIKVQIAQSDWQAADRLIRDSHVLFGCIDGYRQRKYLEIAARRFGLAYIDIGMDVTQVDEGAYAVAGQTIATYPDLPCMTCIGFLTPERLEREENRYGDAGINPQVVWTNGSLASIAVGTFVQMFTPWFRANDEFKWLELDGNAQLVSDSRQPQYFLRGPCTHFSSGDRGDPFFDLSKSVQVEADEQPVNLTPWYLQLWSNFRGVFAGR